MNQSDAWLMIRRRAKAAGIDAPIGNHTFGPGRVVHRKLKGSYTTAPATGSRSMKSSGSG